MRKLVPFIIVVTLVVGAVTTSSGQLELEPTAVRVEERIGAWEFGCVGFGTPGRPETSSPVCVSTSMPTFAVESPAGAPTVDVVVTVSFQYETTKGEWPDVVMRWKPEGGTFKSMTPGEFKFQPASAFEETATATWFRRNLAGAGDTYIFKMDVDLHKNSANRLVTGRNTVVVIDMRASEE